MLKINRRIKDIVGSTTLAITARAKELQTQGRDVVSFGAGEPDFDTPDFIKKAAIQAIEKGLTKYTPSTGTVELREAIAQKFLADNSLKYSPNQIVVTCGAKHALFDIISVLVDDGDEVIFQSPYWVSYPEMVKAAGGKSIVVSTNAGDNFKFSASDLEKHITSRTKAVIINSPSNPTGVMYTKSELQAIASVCVKHKIYVISDEIYEKLIYDQEQFVSIASLGKEIYDLTFTVNGVSKAYSMTGWRIGYCAGPQEAMDYIKKFQDHSTSNPTSISQAAAFAALKAPQDSVEAMRLEFKSRRDYMLSLLEAQPKISYVRPQGAFYVFCQFSGFGPIAGVAKRILDEANVAVIPGDGFGAEGYIRLSFATSKERIAEGIKRIKQWMASTPNS